MKKIALIACVAFALFFGQQARGQDGDGILTEIKNLKANMNAVLSGQTAAKAQIDVLAMQVKTLSDKIDAMQSQKATAAQLVWQPAKVGSWGQVIAPGAWVDPAATSPPVAVVAEPVMMSSCTGAGACANGSCGTGRTGLFGRLRGGSCGTGRAGLFGRLR